jgi:hypothetical protein
LSLHPTGYLFLQEDIQALINFCSRLTRFTLLSRGGVRQAPLRFMPVLPPTVTHFECDITYWRRRVQMKPLLQELSQCLVNLTFRGHGRAMYPLHFTKLVTLNLANHAEFPSTWKTPALRHLSCSARALPKRVSFDNTRNVTHLSFYYYDGDAAPGVSLQNALDICPKLENLAVIKQERSPLPFASTRPEDMQNLRLTANRHPHLKRIECFLDREPNNWIVGKGLMRAFPDLSELWVYVNVWKDFSDISALSRSSPGGAWSTIKEALSYSVEGVPLSINLEEEFSSADDTDAPEVIVHVISPSDDTGGGSGTSAVPRNIKVSRSHWSRAPLDSKVANALGIGCQIQ